MATVSYFISIKTSHDATKVLLAILNTAGIGRAIYGENDNEINKSLWIIPKGKKTQLEVATGLLSEPAIHNAFVVGLSNPVTEHELKEVRRLFTEFGWDLSAVSDVELSLYVNTQVQRRLGYYIDFDEKKNGPVKIRVKPIQEHPQFSEKWLEQDIPYEEEVENKVFTIDDIEIKHVYFQETLELDDNDETSPRPSDEQNRIK